MATTPNTPDSSDYTANERRALVRQLTNMLNQREKDRRHFNEHFNRYGVLLKGIFQFMSDQNKKIAEIHDLVDRTYKLGIWWEDDSKARAEDADSTTSADQEWL